MKPLPASITSAPARRDGRAACGARQNAARWSFADRAAPSAGRRRCASCWVRRPAEGRRAPRAPRPPCAGLGHLARRVGVAHEGRADGHPDVCRRGRSAVRIRIGASRSAARLVPAEQGQRARVVPAAAARAGDDRGRRSPSGCRSRSARTSSPSAPRAGPARRPSRRYSVCARCDISLRYGPRCGHRPGRRRHHLELLVDDHHSSSISLRRRGSRATLGAGRRRRAGTCR